MERLTVLIPDLNCPGCVPQLEQVMREQEGVVWAIVNFAAGEATVIYDPAAFKKQQLLQAVEHLGYQVTPVKPPAVRSRTNSVSTRSFARVQRWVRALYH